MATELWTATRHPSGKLTIDVNPHPGQARAILSTKRFVFMLAGTQGGKTSFGPLWLLNEILAKGPGDYIGVTSTHPLLQLKMLPEFLRLFEHTLGLGKWFPSRNAFEMGEHAADYFNWGTGLPDSRVIFGSAVNPESLESATGKAAWLDEIGQKDFRLESWEAVIRRLSIHQGRVLAGTTLYNFGWMKSQIYDPWLRHDPKAKDVEVIQFPSTLNPAFPPEELERVRGIMTDWKYQMFYLGRYKRPAGLIYSDFDDRYQSDGGMKVQPFEIPPSWRRTIGGDFGAVNTALVYLAEDPATAVQYLYRESLQGGKTSSEHAKTALEAVAGCADVDWWGGSKSEDQQRRDYAEAGVPFQAPYVADVEAQIDRVIALMKARRLLVFDSCAGVLDELGTYSRETNDAGEVSDKIRDKNDFHRMDALRYACQGIGLGFTAW
jgi:hypothetical protein